MKFLIAEVFMLGRPEHAGKVCLGCRHAYMRTVSVHTDSTVTTKQNRNE